MVAGLAGEGLVWARRAGGVGHAGSARPGGGLGGARRGSLGSGREDVDRGDVPAVCQGGARQQSDSQSQGNAS